MPMQPAILGTARLANFRLGYRPAALTTRRLTKSRITIGGVARRVREGSVTVSDQLNEAPNIAGLVVDGLHSYPGAVVGAQPLGYWRLGDLSGPVALDSSGHGHPGTIVGGVTLGGAGALSDGNPSMALNGTTGYIDIGPVPAFAFTGAFSAALWFKTSTVGLARLLGKFDQAAQSGWLLTLTSTGLIGARGFSAGTARFSLNSPAVYTDGLWHHVVLTWNGSTAAGAVKLSVDGAVVQTGTASAGALGTPAVPLRIGAHGDAVAFTFGGSIDEVALYGAVLTPAQIAQHYALRTALPPPRGGQDLRISLNSDVPRLLFGGALQTVDLTYESQPSNVVWPCSAIDDTDRANYKRPFGTWTNTSATTVAQWLITTFAPGFSAAGIALGLPPVSVNFDGTEGMSGAFAQLAKVIGGSFKFDNGVAYLFLTDTTDAPDPITLGYPFLDDPPIRWSSDDSQIRTRVSGKGHGEATLSEVAVGETIVPLADTAMFNVLGGRTISLTQRFTYTGTQRGGGGSLVGPGLAPSTTPTVSPSGGTGVETGVHKYAYTWTTAAGETTPSPLATVTHGVLPTPTITPTYAGTSVGAPFTTAYPVGASVVYKVSYSGAAGISDTSNDTAAGPTSAPIIVTADPTFGNAQTIVVRVTHTPDAYTGRVHVWRSINGGTFTLVADRNPSPTTTFTFDDVTSTGGAPSFPFANPGVNRSTLSNIPLGPTGTTGRKVYRTVASGSQLKLQQTIANNTATAGAQDSTPDASLGANAPAGDTSGLSSTPGQVNAGATSMLTAGAGVFSSGGGWVLPPSGAQPIRYTGITGNTLTGIPTSGVGAILVTIPYGSALVSAPMLTGVTGLVLPLAKGDPVNIWVQRDDLVAQAERIALDLAQGRVSDGVIEGPLIVDERRGEDSLTALLDATLQLYARAIETVKYATRDVKSTSGKQVPIDLPSPPIHGTFTIQSVDISEIDIWPGTNPRYDVVASSVRFSLESLLAKLLKGVAA